MTAREAAVRGSYWGRRRGGDRRVRGVDSGCAAGVALCHDPDQGHHKDAHVAVVGVRVMILIPLPAPLPAACTPAHLQGCTPIGILTAGARAGTATARAGSVTLDPAARAGAPGAGGRARVLHV